MMERAAELRRVGEERRRLAQERLSETLREKAKQQGAVPNKRKRGHIGGENNPKRVAPLMAALLKKVKQMRSSGYARAVSWSTLPSAAPTPDETYNAVGQEEPPASPTVRGDSSWDPEATRPPPVFDDDDEAAAADFGEDEIDVKPSLISVVRWEKVRVGIDKWRTRRVVAGRKHLPVVEIKLPEKLTEDLYIAAEEPPPPSSDNEEAAAAGQFPCTADGLP